MANRFHGFRRRVVASGRKTFWLAGAVSQTTLASTSSAVVITSLNAAALALRPFTIVRTRGVWSVFSDQTAADENQFVQFGGIVVSDQAVAVGITAVPTPAEQDSSPWFFFDTALQRFNIGSDIGLVPNFAPDRYVIDSKSMRKVEEGQDIIGVVQNAAAGAGSIVNTYFKILIKLH